MFSLTAELDVYQRELYPKKKSAVNENNLLIKMKRTVYHLPKDLSGVISKEGNKQTKRQEKLICIRGEKSEVMKK